MIPFCGEQNLTPVFPHPSITTNLEILHPIFSQHARRVCAPTFELNNILFRVTTRITLQQNKKI